MVFQNVARELIRSGFVRSLRIAFEANSDFRYQQHPSDPYQPAEDSGIFIYDSWPFKKASYPAVVVNLGPADPFLRTLGGEHQFDSTEQYLSGEDGLSYSRITGETFGGGSQTSVNIEVFARSAIERSQIMDWITIYVRHLFVRTFEKEGVTVISMRQGSESSLLIGNDPVYKDSLDIEVYSEFEHTISTSLQGTINAISLTNVFTVLPNGASTY